MNKYRPTVRMVCPTTRSDDLSVRCVTLAYTNSDSQHPDLVLRHLEAAERAEPEAALPDGERAWNTCAARMQAEAAPLLARRSFAIMDREDDLPLRPFLGGVLSLLCDPVFVGRRARRYAAHGWQMCL
jgi:hypothetical protein